MGLIEPVFRGLDAVSDFLECHAGESTAWYGKFSEEERYRCWDQWCCNNRRMQRQRPKEKSKNKTSNNKKTR